MPFLLSDSKIEVAHVVPVTLFQKPADCSVLSTKPHDEPEVANCRLTLVGPGCSANYEIVNCVHASRTMLQTDIRIEEGKVLSKLR